ISAALGWIAVTVVDMRRHGWLRPLGRIVARTIVLLAVCYLAFLVLWGLNYRRVPLAQKLRFDAANVSTSAARPLAAVVTERANALYAQAHGGSRPGDDGGFVDQPLAEAFARAQRELGVGRPALPGRPKHTLLEMYFRRAGVDGMTDPFFLESLVASD